MYPSLCVRAVEHAGQRIDYLAEHDVSKAA